MKNFKNLLYVAGAACFVLTGIASATPMGQLNVTNCSGGGVTVTTTTIDWLLPVGGGNGCLSTDTNTNVTFTGGGPLLSGDVTGLIKDLPAGSNLDFMIFTDQPNLHFDLGALGPAPSNTVCSTTTNVNNPSCSVIAGSPFTLTPNGNGTTVTLAASGIARDTTGQTPWGGSYTTQFAGITPAQLQSAILGGTPIAGVCVAGACTSTYSGSFNLTIAPTVPEPGTVSLFLLAGVALIGIGRKRFNKI